MSLAWHYMWLNVYCAPNAARPTKRVGPDLHLQECPARILDADVSMIPAKDIVDHGAHHFINGRRKWPGRATRHGCQLTTQVRVAELLDGDATRYPAATAATVTMEAPQAWGVLTRWDVTAKSVNDYHVPQIFTVQVLFSWTRTWTTCSSFPGRLLLMHRSARAVASSNDIALQTRRHILSRNCSAREAF